MKPRLILASSSPQRAEILRSAGFAFDVVPAQLEETYDGTEPPAAFAERMAEEKARTVAQRFRPAEAVVVLGADTLVVLEGAMLRKPDSAGEARAMLEQLSGRMHEVITGVALAAPESPRRAVAHEVTRVFFRALTAKEIEDYVTGGEPLGKAGAYAVQGRAARFVTAWRVAPSMWWACPWRWWIACCASGRPEADSAPPKLAWLNRARLWAFLPARPPGRACSRP